MIKLIASDMDGTILTDNLHISSENIQAVKEAQSKGVKVAIATGRNFFEAINPLKNAGLQDIYLITANGAQIFNNKQEVIHKQALNNEHIIEIIQFLLDKNVCLEISTEDGLIAEDKARRTKLLGFMIQKHNPHLTVSEATEQAEEFLSKVMTKYVHSIIEEIKNHKIDVLKIFAMSETMDKDFVRIKDELNAKYDDLIITNSGHFNLEVNHKDAHKGAAVAILAKYLNIQQMEVFAIGDSFNDETMLKYAGYSVAMANADLEIQQMAKFTTTKNTENGFAKAVNEMLAKQ